MSKYFPIKTDTACQLKWTWSTIHLYNGETNSCHRVATSQIDPKNFSSFHNTQKKISDRKLMLEGTWPSGGCEYCQRIEDAGGKSDRIFQLEIPDLTPPELDQDPTAVEVTPRILEVYLDNVCNMSCVYCEDKFSSRIEKENIRFGEFKQGSLEIKNVSKKHPDFEKMHEEFWSWVDNNYHTLKRLHVLGGEPFFQPQFETCLEFLENHSNPQLEFNIVTNLKIPLTKLHSYIDRIKNLLKNRKIGRLDITCSIDCWGEEQEYIRYGIDMEEWKRNFSYLASQKWIKLNINQTLTSLGMKSMKELLVYINSHRQQRKIEHYFMSCMSPAQLNPKIFGPGFFDKEFDELLSVMPNDTWQDRHARNSMEGIKLEINASRRDAEQIKNLKIFLDELDRRRGLDWKKTFPWLEKELSDVV